jgi:hypothetical protein
MLKTTWRRYAAWTLRQASTANCGHAVAGAVAIAAIAVVVVVRLYWAVIVEVAEVVIAVAAVTAAVGLAYGGYRAWRALTHRGAPLAAGGGWQPRTVPAVIPPAAPGQACARGCGRPADGEVTWANGVRSGTEALCAPCQAATELADRMFLAGLDERREREARTWPQLRDVPDPARYDLDQMAGPDGVPVRASEDNRPAADAGTAAELARVLRESAADYEPGHP